jgi:hypothetical protein
MRVLIVSITKSDVTSRDLASNAHGEASLINVLIERGLIPRERRLYLLLARNAFAPRGNVTFRDLVHSASRARKNISVLIGMLLCRHQLHRS